jgi:hypothetical protein
MRSFFVMSRPAAAGKHLLLFGNCIFRKDAYSDSQNLMVAAPKAPPTFIYRPVLNLCVLRVRR